jgi:N-acetylglucosaminyldiphosphoundecaprenol N-acetyl-beta-D-mannosaminyltransferase
LDAAELPKVRIGHADIACITFADAAEKILTAAKERQSKYIVTPNTDHILQLESDLELRAAYEGAMLVLCDGRPVFWASHILGTPLPEVITGADMMPALCRLGAARGLRVALVGGPPGSAELQIVWAYCPPIGFDRDRAASKLIVDELNSLDCDLVFLGVGAPKQEKWILNHSRELRVGVLLGIGAAIEFVAGTLPRAPRILRRIGLEWAFRLWHVPRRLAKRYLKDLFFVVIVGRQFLDRIIVRQRS